MKRLYQPMHRQAAAGPRQRPSDGGCVDRLNPSPRIGSKCDPPSSRSVARGAVMARLPLRELVDRNQKSSARHACRATQLGVRGTRSVRVSLGCLSLPSTA
jgi:hypothetical protein